jgi:hypothetical protein
MLGAIVIILIISIYIYKNGLESKREPTPKSLEQQWDEYLSYWAGADYYCCILCEQSFQHCSPPDWPYSWDGHIKYLTEARMEFHNLFPEVSCSHGTLTLNELRTSDWWVKDWVKKGAGSNEFPDRVLFAKEHCTTPEFLQRYEMRVQRYEIKKQEQERIKAEQERIKAEQERIKAEQRAIREAAIQQKQRAIREAAIVAKNTRE